MPSPLDVRPWREIQIELTAEASYAAPYADVEVWADFTCGDDVLRRPAFWDGGDTWKVRFAPTRPGRWTWRSDSIVDDSGLAGRSGALDAVDGSDDPDPFVRHGFWRMSPGGRNLVHADGTPALLVADTAWALPWRATADQVGSMRPGGATKGFNAVLLMTVQPDMQAVGPRDRHADGGFDVGFDDLPDRPPQRARPWLLPPPSTPWSRSCASTASSPCCSRSSSASAGRDWTSPGPVIPPEEYARYCRYLAARYGAGRPSTWSARTAAGTSRSSRPAGAELERGTPTDSPPASTTDRTAEPRLPGRGLARLPVVPDRPHRRACPRAGRGHAAQSAGQGRRQRRAHL